MARIWARAGLVFLAGLGVVACRISSIADYNGNDFTDWNNGQLIFISGDDVLDRAVAAATGAHYTHVGIVRLTGGGAVVLDTRPTLGEPFVEEFLTSAYKGRYAVYAVRGVSGERGFTPPRRANDYLHTPDDPFLRPDKSEMSGAELVNISFKSVGIDLGKPERVFGGKQNNDAVRAWFEEIWTRHPDCRAEALSKTECKAFVARQDIVTPASLAEDPRTVCLWSNFEKDIGRCPRAN